MPFESVLQWLYSYVPTYANWKFYRQVKISCGKYLCLDLRPLYVCYVVMYLGRLANYVITEIFVCVKTWNWNL